ncbi:prenyltransferase/squalene oxidase repeat-containing protein [Crossiella cryophila]|uniref:Squalene-hopene/tetraprenyl-beta-curcumene cyclase n=1 Tax=Crossiella cryophila TaxID=43355 RepID=A0A7W7CED3_9PSEU|nr:prenyltransferase/squalene oxidase repeat-containing protein [Crossiella cryophila]MBB4679604.1 squalene-hopene/tetraprenyl-beta-curcumene cyclase [Crossiella cryophila]
MPSFPHALTLSSALAGAVTHSLVHRRPDSSWCGTPDPRVLDTAVTAIALAACADEAGRAAVARARSWLRHADPQTHHPLAYELEAALRALALGQEVRHTAASTDIVLSGRTRLLTVLAGHSLPGAGCPRTALRAELDRGLRERLKPWTVVELLAGIAILAMRAGDLGEARAAVARLRPHQWPDGSFYGNPVCTALALLALALTGSEPDLLDRTRRRVLRTQQEDGTWRFCASEVWDTALMVRAGQGLPRFDRHALPGALAFLAAAQNPDGGWSYTRGLESDNDTTGAVLLALGGRSLPGRGLPRALAYLAGQQTADGLWRTWQYRQDPPAQDVVAHVLGGLHQYRGQHHIPLAPATRWLGECWQREGRWSSSWYRGLPYATAEVGAALAGQEVLDHAVKALLANQNGDGGWGAEAGLASSAAATGLALLALSRSRVLDPDSREAAVTWLLRTRPADGTWAGEPDMYGPRPMLVHYPTQTHAFVLLGLRAALVHRTSDVWCSDYRNGPAAGVPGSLLSRFST